MCGRTARTVREGGTGEVETQTRWITRTRRETAGIEPIRRTGHTEPVPYFTGAVDPGNSCSRETFWGALEEPDHPQG